jgi:sterol desaturase/sphingolipid hydroxylase (fatty acid hydroxylase superfamily)
MTIGTSIVLIAAGAILKWAVTAHVSGINLETVGTILFVLGIVGLILSLFYTFMWSHRAPVDETRTVRRPPAPDDRYY